MIRIDEVAKEKGTIAFVVSFEDESGDAAAPDTLVWSLTDTDGNVINELDQEVVSSPAASNTVVLSGNDLQILSSESSQTAVVRKFVVEATYDSDIGNDLPVKDVAVFTLENLTKIT